MQPPAAPSSAPFVGALRRLGWPLALLLPALGLAVFALQAAYGPRNYYDFHIFWHAGKDVLAGRSPYPAPTIQALRHQNQFVYPAPAALAVAPLALLPLGAAATLFIIVNVIAVPASLWLLGVRDWRCWALAFCSIATVQSVVMGTVTCLLLLGAACAWRWRDRTWPAAAAVAAVVMAKLFLVPLIVWLWATGRRRAAALAAGLAGALTLAAWAVIGFRGLRDYPHLLSALSGVEDRFGYSPIALAAGLGLGHTGARVLSLALAGALCAGVLVAGRRGAEGDRRAFSLAIVACLALSPIVWLGYYMLLLAPIALARPRLAPLWALVLAPWLFSNPNTTAPVWKVVLWTCAVAAVAAAVQRSSTAPARTGDLIHT